jgi:hypothetical protein
MTQRSSVAGLVVGLSLFSSNAWGQSSPHRNSDIAAPGRMESAGGPAMSPSGDPFRMSPGHYVLPGPDSPDYWSPHIRPFPDYSYSRAPFSAPLTRSATPFRNYGRQPAYNAAPALGCGSAYVGGYGYAAPFYDDAASAYNQGRYDADREYNWFIASQRAGRLLNQYSAMFDEGMQQFREGNYELAAVSLLGAAESNQSNAASRLHAGHAMFALGRYREGVGHIARAFELSPSLAYKIYDVRDEYGDKTEFDSHLSALQTFVAQNPNDAAGVTMLGYVTFHTQGPGAALPILERASNLDQNSFFIPKLLNLARQTSPTARQGHSATTSKSKVKSKSSHHRSHRSLPPFGV